MSNKPRGFQADQPLDTHQSSLNLHDVLRDPEINKYFRAAVKFNASDIHLKAGSRPRVRVRGELKNTTSSPLTAESIEQLAFEILTTDQKDYLLTHGSIDFAHDVDNEHRFRVNVFRQRGQYSLVGRYVKSVIPSFNDLRLPEVISRIAETAEAGLILLAGITGSGKSTTIAAMLEHINATRSVHIVTIEDPIEFVYTDKKSLVNQREIGIDAPNFAHALRALMREDPDVVLIGEMRDRETFEAALQAAETGHLVFGTVHASSSPQTISRILDLFEPADRPAIRQNFAFNLQAIICQKLLPTAKMELGRVPACEVLLANPVVKKFILDGKDNELPDVIRKHGQEGMVELNESIRKLVADGMVDLKTAMEHSPNPEELKMRLKGFTAF